ncbi:hypothetical protein ALC57_17202 [Trachymyrmex cornetzi]|uniref:Uncharacterized protein n=1 Tax=Trachymyrmex cornetzi TaxID=471704 RepID=A0A195DCN2_9HYME|nr:hypothetical protein ALC57_17202 [Trachymyrmex cornetzi]
MEREDEDFGEGYIAESHPLRPTHLTVPLGGRGDSRAPSISSSVSDLDVPIYTRETTIPLSARKVKLSSRCVHRTSDMLRTKLNTHENRTCAVSRDDSNDCHLKYERGLVGAGRSTPDDDRRCLIASIRGVPP